VQATALFLKIKKFFAKKFAKTSVSGKSYQIKWSIFAKESEKKKFQNG
jgi:hypothetical protein